MKEAATNHCQRCSAHLQVQVLVWLREAGAACLCFIICVLWDRQPKKGLEHLDEKLLKIKWAVKINVESLLVCRTFYFCFAGRVTLRIFCLSNRGEVLLIWTPLPGAMCDELFFIKLAFSFDQFLIHRAMVPKGDDQSVPAWSSLRDTTLGREQTTEQDGERAGVRI